MHGRCLDLPSPLSLSDRRMGIRTDMENLQIHYPGRYRALHRLPHQRRPRRPPSLLSAPTPLQPLGTNNNNPQAYSLLLHPNLHLLSTSPLLSSSRSQDITDEATPSTGERIFKFTLEFKSGVRWKLAAPSRDERKFWLEALFSHQGISGGLVGPPSPAKPLPLSSPSPSPSPLSNIGPKEATTPPTAPSTSKGKQAIENHQKLPIHFFRSPSPHLDQRNMLLALILEPQAVPHLTSPLLEDSCGEA